ncbi:MULTISPECIES: ribosomal protein S18-alanine N-acetyltransferase [unclassified Corynebacterium]|uniref:ribosomal protein S18-alanine N-acetyltransferase n=1 Tax=unclassified Corynebacterium TaxID=2624378 RepID=UPI0029C9CB39|nr:MULTISPECIES: ribosomal protein S18-alanine N-acetyltransferase [unclassified Corynebacterium]WPF66538.1 ribosomal protein S18-alanine N-acetyltransferase [Corynebacterium sp. 22KM0430]WPF69027.1 ribosomal protein S18-alanine N-acetyltransferase [Corynebacterium sp. 21KM1197]
MVGLRRLTTADAARCAELEQVLFPGDSPWPRQAFEKEIAHPSSFYVGAQDGDLLVGYAGLVVLGPSDSPECEVYTIGVDPAYQGRGLGRELLEQLLHTADLLEAPVFLEVRTDNAPAIGLYESKGFTITGTRRNYYQPSGADAYTMMREATVKPS